MTATPIYGNRGVEVTRNNGLSSFMGIWPLGVARLRESVQFWPIASFKLHKKNFMDGIYYGRMKGKKPKKGVDHSIFEEAMNQKLAACLDKLKIESEKITKQYKSKIEALLDETKLLNQRFGGLLKIFEKDELKEKIKEHKSESKD